MSREVDIIASAKTTENGQTKFDFSRVMVSKVSAGTYAVVGEGNSANAGGTTFAVLITEEAGGGGKAGGGRSKTLSTINAIAGATSFTADAASNTLTSTKVGGNIAYTLSNSKIFLTSIKYLKPIGYGASGVSILTDVGLSINGQQSWTETGINTGVTAGAMIIGGWPGLIIQLDYIGAKAYLRTTREHPEWILPYHSFFH